VLMTSHSSCKGSNKSSAVAEMGDRGHNRHGLKERGGGAVPLSRSDGNPSITMWPVRRSTSVPSGVFVLLGRGGGPHLTQSRLG